MNGSNLRDLFPHLIHVVSEHNSPENASATKPVIERPGPPAPSSEVPPAPPPPPEAQLLGVGSWRARRWAPPCALSYLVMRSSASEMPSNTATRNSCASLMGGWGAGGGRCVGGEASDESRHVPRVPADHTLRGVQRGTKCCTVSGEVLVAPSSAHPHVPAPRLPRLCRGCRRHHHCSRWQWVHRVCPAPRWVSMRTGRAADYRPVH